MATVPSAPSQKFQTWLKWLRYHHHIQGYFEAYNATGLKPLLLNNQIPSFIPNCQDSLLIQVLQQFDLNFETH
jgi:hypothetical protein